MRKLIIDTDCGSDDAVALIMALKSREVSVEAITTVGGNVPMELATQNALMTMEITGAQMPPLYAGAAKPLFRELVTAVNVHGEDGMGDLGLIHPAGAAETEHAADAILRIVKTYPDEVEIVTIGPVTNIALAIMKDPAAMRRVKHIYSMGTAGFGPGNCTPVSEFNIYVDAEAFHRMITAEIPVTIVGFDLCLGDAVLTKEDMEALMNSGKEEAIFSVKCNRLLAEYNLAAHNQYFVDLPDAVAMAVALWDDIAIEKKPCYAYVCRKEEAAYGQVIFNDGSKLAIQEGFGEHAPNVEVCTKLDNALYKKRLLSLLMEKNTCHIV